MFKKESVHPVFLQNVDAYQHRMTSGPRTKLKSSAQRAVRAKVCEAFPLLAPSIDAIIPKKEQLDVVKL